MPRITSETTATVEIDGEETDILVRFTYSPGRPGRYSGAWEDCYPAEDAEVEIIGAWRLIRERVPTYWGGTTTRDRGGDPVELSADDERRICDEIAQDDFVGCEA